jgi:hypothetical protein
MSVTVELVSNSYRRHNPRAQTISTMTGIAVRSENHERVQTRPATMTLPRKIRQTILRISARGPSRRAVGIDHRPTSRCRCIKFRRILP